MHSLGSTQERKGNSAILSVTTLITTSAQLTLKRSDRNVNHLVWLDACIAGHLTPGLPELPAMLDLQQQPGWVTTKQQWHAAAGLQTTSCTKTSPAVIRGRQTAWAGRACWCCGTGHKLHQIHPAPLPSPSSNPRSLFSSRLSKGKTFMRKWSKTRSSFWVFWFTYRLLAHPSKQKLAGLPATRARQLNNSKHQTSNVKPNEQLWWLQQTLVSSHHLPLSWLSTSSLRHHIWLLMLDSAQGSTQLPNWKLPACTSCWAPKGPDREVCIGVHWGSTI